MGKFKYLLLLTLFLSACVFNKDKQLEPSQWTSSLHGASFKAMDGEGRLVKKSLLKQKGFAPLSSDAALTYVRNQERTYADKLEPYGVVVQRAGHDLILVFFDEILFADSQYKVKPDFQNKLDFVIKEINEKNRSYIEVIGFTDSIGSALQNKEQSYKKATSIASYLVNNNVNVYRIFVDGKGEDYPIAENNTARGRALNKRIEIRISPIFE